MVNESETLVSERVRARELNFRDRILWPVNGERAVCRVDGVLRAEFGGHLVAVTLFLRTPDGSRERVDLGADDQVDRILEGEST